MSILDIAKEDTSVAVGVFVMNLRIDTRKCSAE